MQLTLRFALAALIPLLLPATPRAETFDSALYDRILQRHTQEVPDTARVRVDYRGLAGSEDWKRLVANLARSETEALRTREEKRQFLNGNRAAMRKRHASTNCRTAEALPVHQHLENQIRALELGLPTDTVHHLSQSTTLVG